MIRLMVQTIRVRHDGHCFSAGYLHSTLNFVYGYTFTFNLHPVITSALHTGFPITGGSYVLVMEGNNGD